MRKYYLTNKITSLAKQTLPKQNKEIAEKEKCKNSKIFFDQIINDD